MAERSTGYVFGFATAVCLGCAVLVAGSAVTLKDQQEANVKVDKQSKVLIVAGIVDEDEPRDPAAIQDLYKSRIQLQVIKLADGTVDESVDASTFDQAKAARDPAMSHRPPENSAKVLSVPEHALIYNVMKDGKLDKVVLPIEGMGLWKMMYGYLALESDYNTVAGITFYQHGETPGLGAEVENPVWKARWKGRRIFDDAGVVQFRVIKGSAGPASTDPFRTDGLSGATLTSNGVTNSIHFWMGENGFGKYLEKVRKQKGAS
jgi:Na+-transporting NADH:ubiquinone oxidoreductase subunit C